MAPSAPFASMLLDRRMALVIVGAVVVHVGFVVLGLPGFPCPAFDLFDRPCPGCGLSRAVAALLGGDFESMARLHAFAPVALVGLVLLGAAAVLPAAATQRLARVVAAAERFTRISLALGVAVVVYWLVRLTLGGEALFTLLR